MAVNEADIPTRVSTVWQVLSTPQLYAEWVVGAAEVGRTAGPWPEPGATFAHSQGVFPVRIHDTTTVLECEPQRRLLLEARARPLAVAHVERVLEQTARGTHVRMTEHAVGGALRLLPRPLQNMLVSPRNAASLQRLSDLAARVERGGVPTG